MENLDPRLVDAINRGTCFALVGSGPSNELGYPSWSALSSAAMEAVHSDGLSSDDEAYAKYFKEQKFAEILDLAERDLGSRTALIERLAPLMVPSGHGSHRIYDFLIRSPFRCYLTTNYDDELADRLRASGHYYKVVQNDRDGFFLFRDGAQGLILKLHGDFEHPENLVLTATDYRLLEADPKFEHYRTRLESIMFMFDVCIIGHSFSDPDLAGLLARAKQVSSAAHPVFMIAANLTNDEKYRLREDFNIVAVTYRSENHDHGGLVHILDAAGPYVGPRTASARPRDAREHTAEARTAASLLLYRRLNPALSEGQDAATQALSPLVMYALQNDHGSEGATIPELLAGMTLKETVVSRAIESLVEPCLESLVAKDLAVRHGDRFALTEAGALKVSQVGLVREQQEDQAYGQFVTDVEHELGHRLDLAEQETMTEILREALVGAFESRGHAIAQAVFTDQSIDNSDLGNLFGQVSLAATRLPVGHERVAFTRAVSNLLLHPSEAQRDYLVSLSQGFFLYHLAGLDPHCARVRRELFDTTAWLFDSSVLLPLLAKGCSNHDYAVALFGQLNSLNGVAITTAKLVREVKDHLDWARDVAQRYNPRSLDFLARAIQLDDFKQNLFLDGYVRLTAAGEVASFPDYLRLVLPKGVSEPAIREALSRSGVNTWALSEVDGISEADYARIQELQDDVVAARKKRGTYRSPRQALNEAEVFQLISGLDEGRMHLPGVASQPTRTYFVSQSRILNDVQVTERVTTWTPESLYRFMEALPGSVIDPTIFQQCMLDSYYRSGVTFIDKDAYLKFFGGMLSDARADFENEKRAFLHEQARVTEAELDRSFDETPDLEKPFFVRQMVRQTELSTQARLERKDTRIHELEARVKKLTQDNTKGLRQLSKERAQQLIAEERNKLDPRKVRKRRKQGKKRARKK